MDPRDGGETKSSLPLLTTYRPLPLTRPSDPENLGGPHCCPGYEECPRYEEDRVPVVWTSGRAGRVRRRAPPRTRSAVRRVGGGGRGTQGDGACFRQIIRKPSESER